MKQIADVINNEAPISRDQLCKRVLSMWGISRIGNRIDAHFSRLFSRMNLNYTVTGDEFFFWRSDQDAERYLNYRVYMTTAADISPEEVSVAVKEILEEQISLLQSDLIRETAKIFGFSRIGTIVESSMQRGIQKAIDRGFAKAEYGRVLLVDTH